MQQGEPKGWLLLKNGKGVRTGAVKLSFPRLFELDPTAEFDKDKYTTNIIVSEEEKNYLLSVVCANTYTDAVANYQKWGGKKPNNFQTPDFKELDDDEVKLFYPNGSGKYYSLKAKTSVKPQVVDLQANKIDDKDALYSGVIARVSLSCFPWTYAGKSGLSFSIGIVQKLADASRVGGSQAQDMSLFADTSDVDFDGISGGDPFSVATQQSGNDNPFAQPATGGAAGSNDTDLLMQPNGMQPMKTAAPTANGDPLPF